VTDLLGDFKPREDYSWRDCKVSRRIIDLERKTSTSFFWEDIKIDRWARSARRAELLIQYMNHAVDVLTESYEEYDPIAALGEYTMAIYRYTHRLFASDSKLMFYPVSTRYYNRVYFETDLFWEWSKCIEVYNKYIVNGLPSDVYREIYPFYRKIVEERASRPNYTIYQNKSSVGYTSLRKLSPRDLLKKIISGIAIAQIDKRNIRDLVLERGFHEKMARMLKERISHYRYNRLVSKCLPEKIKFAVYFLHYQPEYTSEALGKFYQDQRHLIRTIASSLPADMLLVVKEHPTMIGLRETDYYTDLLSISNIVLIHHGYDSLELIEKSKIVFTIVGTPALEAMFIGKPAIMFGRYAFSNINTISLCTDIWNLGNMIREKLSASYDLEDLKKHSLALLAAKYVASRPGQVPVATELIPEFMENKEQTTLIMNAFKDELKERGLIA